MKVQTIQLMQKEIDVASSQILLEESFGGSTLSGCWQVKSGEWHVDNGWLSGRNRGNFPGMVVSHDELYGNVMVEFEARTVLPSTHDINVMWNGSWDDSANQRGTAYVAGLQGWWEGKVGIEKSPEYRFMSGSGMFVFEPGRIYHVVAGSIDGHCFVMADGKLLLEALDPDPIDHSRFGKVGFEAYCSWINVRNVRVRRIAWRPLQMSYQPEW